MLDFPGDIMERTVITNATLLDCTGREPVPGAAVLIEGDRILAAGSQADVLPAEGDFRTIDAGAGCCCPASSTRTST